MTEWYKKKTGMGISDVVGLIRAVRKHDVFQSIEMRDKLITAIRRYGARWHSPPTLP
jgi:hypothetical protein